jgi:hypothetical protein
LEDRHVPSDATFNGLFKDDVGEVKTTLRSSGVVVIDLDGECWSRRDATTWSVNP